MKLAKLYCTLDYDNQHQNYRNSRSDWMEKCVHKEMSVVLVLNIRKKRTISTKLKRTIERDFALSIRVRVDKILKASCP